jgi:hypothetical protein
MMLLLRGRKIAAARVLFDPGNEGEVATVAYISKSWLTRAARMADNSSPSDVWHYSGAVSPLL